MLDRDRLKIAALEKARVILRRPSKHRPPIRWTIRQRTQVLDQWPKS
jgi:hypothetical protein